MARRDPALIGQEFELQAANGETFYVKVTKSHLNEGYGLQILNEESEENLNFEHLCEETIGEVPALYNEKDVLEVVSQIFETNLEEVDSIPEWDNARKLRSAAHREQLRIAQEEILSGVYLDSHARTGDILFLRFGNVILKCEPKWTEG